MDFEFRWNRNNAEHIGQHGIVPWEAEYIVTHARPPFPEERADGKYLAMGQTPDGSYLQVIYIFSPADVI